MSYTELLPILIQNYGISAILQGLGDLHIQKSMMSMLSVNTMEELGALYGKLHGFQRQGSIVDQCRSNQIQRTSQRSPETLRQRIN